MPTECPAIIFDFGNVIAYFDYDRAFTTLGAPFGLEGRAVRDRAPDLGEFARLYESGRIGTAEFTEAAIRSIGLPIGTEDFADAWSDIFRINAPVAAFAASLKSSGRRLILGSNTNSLHADHFRRRFADELACFDQLVLSFEVKHLKPSASFYLACAEAAGLSPADCVFIDDLPENVEGARLAGLAAIQYSDLDALVGDLGDLGVRASS